MSPSNSITENRPNDIEDVFFKNLNTEENDDKNRMKKFQMKKTENLLNKKFMKEMVSSIIDMTEVYYDYQQNNEKELIDIKKWNKIIDKFIHNKPAVKRKKKKKVLTEEEIGNLNFDSNSPLD
jgi:tRNA(Met) C34 N-acetyltransferase TmcA